MNLTTMIANVRYTVEDSAGTYVTDAEITQYLNDAALDLNARLKVLTKETSSTVSTSDGTIALPTDFISPITLRLGTDDVEWVADDVFWYASDNALSVSPTYGRIFNEFIETYPAAANGTAYKLRYVKKPTALSAGADVSAIPEEHHKRMVDFARARARLKEGYEGQSDRYMAMYEDGLPAMTPRNRVIPGPLTITMEGGPFDRIDSAHI